MGWRQILEKQTKKTVESLVKVLEKRNVSTVDMYTVDGWLFQMISWLQLANQYKGDIFFQQSPHSQPSMHGIDGFAVKLTPNNTIERIVITEDKCTENAKTTIRDKVWPEFSGFELHSIRPLCITPVCNKW